MSVFPSLCHSGQVPRRLELEMLPLGFNLYHVPRWSHDIKNDPMTRTGPQKDPLYLCMCWGLGARC